MKFKSKLIKSLSRQGEQGLASKLRKVFSSNAKMENFKEKYYTSDNEFVIDHYKFNPKLELADEIDFVSKGKYLWLEIRVFPLSHNIELSVVDFKLGSKEEKSFVKYVGGMSEIIDLAEIILELDSPKEKDVMKAFHKSWDSTSSTELEFSEEVRDLALYKADNYVSKYFDGFKILFN